MVIVTIEVTLEILGGQRAEAVLRAEAVAREALKRFGRMPGVLSVSTNAREKEI